MTTDVTPIWQDSPRAAWLVAVASDVEPDNPHSGWTTVHADATTHTVECCCLELTLDEARNLAEALRLAVVHAETFGLRTAELLDHLRGAVGWTEIQALPVPVQRQVRDALAALAARYRRIGPTNHTQQPEAGR